MAKPFLSYDQQIDKLTGEKGLLIPDRGYAIAILKKTSYFALICGYKDPFKNPTTKKYKDGTTFDHIVYLYEFDESLRDLFIKNMMRIERNLRSLISYYFCLEFGDDQKAYLNASNYDQVSQNAPGINTLIERLEAYSDSKDHHYITHHRTNHQNVPLWVLLNAVTFGELSKMFSFLKQSTRSEIAKNFPPIMDHQLVKILRVMTKFRNVCAHGERLFSYKTQEEIPTLSFHSRLNAYRKNGAYLIGKRDLFAIVIAFRYLLWTDDFNTFMTQLDEIIQGYTKKEHSLHSRTLLESMGFPTNWQEVLNR